MSAQRSEKTQRLIDQMEARVGEMTPDERAGMAKAVALFGGPDQVGELRRFVMALFTRLNARQKSDHLAAKAAKRRAA